MKAGGVHMEEHEKCTGFNKLDKRLIVVETEQGAMKSDIKDIKQSQKEARTLAMTTLITSLLSTLGIIAGLVIALGG